METRTRLERSPAGSHRDGRAIDGVDGARLVYQPWSLGGSMAPRVAAFEHRVAAQGAGMHCEMRNRSLANRRILDQLDTTLR